MSTYPYRNRALQSLAVCRCVVERRQLEEIGHECAYGHERTGVSACGLVLQVNINPVKYLAWRGCCVWGSPTYSSPIPM
jgi:hypothetical protein